MTHHRIRRLGALLAAFAATLIIAILLPVTPAAHSAETGRFDTGIRRCTPAEQDAINAMMTGNGGRDGMDDGELGDVDLTGDWLTEGTDAYKVAKEIYDYWTKEIGTSGAFAAGVLGNVRQESQFIPNVSEGGGRYPSQFATSPDAGSSQNGGGLYQFTPATKYISSPHFASGGWTVPPQSRYVWDSEFVTGSVVSGLLNSPNLYGIEAPFTRAYTVVPTGNGQRVILDPDALVTATDPNRAAIGFMVGYERPALLHPERGNDAVRANEVFNPNNYPGDAKKLEKNLPEGVSAGVSIGGELAGLIGSLAGAMSPSDDLVLKIPAAGLFASPCVMPDGTIINNFDEAWDYANAKCRPGGGSGGRNGASLGESAAGENTGNAYEGMHNKDKLHEDADAIAKAIASEFPEINTIGGWRADGGYADDHVEGRAVDVMIDNYQDSGQVALGTEINNWVLDNADKYGVQYTIWRQEYFPVGGSSNIMEDRGSDTQNHFDHVHITVWGDNTPTNGGDSGDRSDGGGGSRSGQSSGNNCGPMGDSAGDGLDASPDDVIIPASGVLTSGFKMRWGTMHPAIDIANEMGTPIYAASSGEVIDAGPATGFGLWIRIRHEDGTITHYGHQNANHVSVGDIVKTGDHIADMASEGQSTGSHLDFGVEIDGQKVDPAQWFHANDVPFPPGDSASSEGTVLEAGNSGSY